jgi:dTDP-4-amino-4,6-dideoxygalactose transaminase
MEKFTGNFTQQDPIPQAGIDAAVEVMKHGRLHRYNVAEGETSQAALLEREFADWLGSTYCLSCASGGYAMAIALRAAGISPGDPVLTNGFTLAPVPGAIAGVGGKPVFVEVTWDLVIDLNDLAQKIAQTGAKFLLLSHMRGHICDMDALMAICDEKGVLVIEDCAHTMGAHWNGVPSGRHGLVGCYSTQTYKHMNSGEGGLLVTDDAELMARATMLSGSYMLFDRHIAGAATEVFEDIKLDTPNCSGRMDNLRAAILRPQLADIDTQIARWNARYKVVEDGLGDLSCLTLIERGDQERFVASSFQFLLPEFSAKMIGEVLKRCANHGVELKWFGHNEPSAFTSRYTSWRYAGNQHLPQTDKVLDAIMDMRLPLTFSLDDYAQIARIIRAQVSVVWQASPHT